MIVRMLLLAGTSSLCHSKTFYPSGGYAARAARRRARRARKRSTIAVARLLRFVRDDEEL